MIKFKTKIPSSNSKYSLEAKPKLPDAVVQDHEPAFVIKDFPQNHILYHIHKNGTRESAARHHNRVHASDLDPARNYCPREGSLLTLYNKKRKSDFLATCTRMTFGMGYKGADLLMDFIPDEKIWGDWKCQSCKHKMEKIYTPKQCAKCGGDRRAIVYQEVLLRDPATGIVGSVDLFVDVLGNGTKTPIEIKTEGNGSFKPRTKPTFDHEWRTMLYLWLVNRSSWTKKHGLSDQEGRVMYFTKEGFDAAPKIKEWHLGDWAKSAVKEYFVQRNDDMISNQIELAASYRNWRNIYDTYQETGMADDHFKLLVNALPPRTPVSLNPACTRCKSCVVKKECWKGTA